jgi:hypothetical protein
MTASNWLELLGLILGGGGGGTAIAKLTRLAVAVEVVAGKIEAISAAAAETGKQVQDHENRLNKANL